MGYRYSNMLSEMKQSEIRELLKYASSDDVISFGGGMPNPQAFAIDDLKEIIDYLVENHGKDVFQYGSTAGIVTLRKEISKMLSETEKIKVSENNIIVTSGSQQGLYASAKVLCDPFDPVITEMPTYIGALSAYNANKVDIHGVEMDDDGIMTEKVEDEIRSLKSSGKPPKFIYVIPTFQNPSGRTMSLERRKHLLEISEENDIPIIEDNPYGELRYSGRRIPSIKSLDKNDSVVYMGTFSKIMTPGLRIGFIAGPQDFVDRINLLKQALDLATNTLSTYIAAEYLSRGIMKKQIPKSIDLYRRKRDIMLRALADHFPDDSEWTKPDGGMFLWARVNSRIDTTLMAKEAISRGVMYVSGSAFYPHMERRDEMRLNFTFPTDEKIEEGIKRLASLIREKTAHL